MIEQPVIEFIGFFDAAIKLLCHRSNETYSILHLCGKMAMRCNFDYQSKKPAFLNWLKLEFVNVFDDIALLSRFVRYTGLKKSRALDIVQGARYAPVLTVEDLDFAWGQFRIHEPNRVFLHINIASAVDEEPDDPLRTMFATAKILHELVHLGRHESELDNTQADWGRRYEIASFAPESSFGLLGADHLPSRFVPNLGSRNEPGSTHQVG